jgi:uncharacterized membrane protein YcaP (DUF421 family)
MDKEDISLTDVQRILFGEAPPEFLAEVLFRTLLVFLALLVFLRLIGKRMGGVLTFSELAVMLTLGAILAVPMQSPERGILQGLLILVCVLVLQRGLNLWEFKSKKVEEQTQGHVILLVKDGVVDCDNLSKKRISRQQIFAELRKNDIHNLGKVKRMYMEACGLFSIYEFDEDKRGLSLLPPSDLDLYESIKDDTNGFVVCCNCGKVERSVHRDAPCKTCHANQWNPAILNLKKKKA